MKADRKISLLLVEDEQQARQLLHKLLLHKFPEVEVHVASDGQEGLELYNRYHPDLVVTDIMMPVLDGVEMTKQIRRADPEAVVIAMTAYNDAEFKTRSEELGFSECIAKPVGFPQFLKVIGDAVQGVRGRILPAV